MLTAERVWVAHTVHSHLVAALARLQPGPNVVLSAATSLQLGGHRVPGVVIIFFCFSCGFLVGRLFQYMLRPAIAGFSSSFFQKQIKSWVKT